MFVDLLSAAAGEADFEVDRVTCFEASCLAFSPIIFNLNRSSGYEEFYKACEKTSFILNDDKDLIKNLVQYISYYSKLIFTVVILYRVT